MKCENKIAGHINSYAIISRKGVKTGKLEGPDLSWYRHENGGSIYPHFIEKLHAIGTYVSQHCREDDRKLYEMIGLYFLIIPTCECLVPAVYMFCRSFLETNSPW